MSVDVTMAMVDMVEQRAIVSVMVCVPVIVIRYVVVPGLILYIRSEVG